MSGNTYELTYFPVRGLGNMIRLVLEDQGVEYKFNQVTGDTWPELKPKTPFGQLPVLKVNGELELAQSHTILRYLGRECGLMGARGSSLEQAQVEMWLDQVIDARQKFLRMMYGNYEAGLKPYLEGLPADLAPFENRLAAVSAGDRQGDSEGKHLVLGRLTVADYALFDLLLVLLALSSSCLDSLPELKAFFDQFGARQRVAAFLARDDIREQKFTGTSHL